MKCRIVRKKISSVLDGEASELDIRRVQEHTNECDACRLFMESMRKSYHLLDDGFRLESESLVPAIERGIRVTSKPRQTRAWGQKLLVPATVCAGLVLGILLGFQLYHLGFVDRGVESRNQSPAPSYDELGVFESLPEGSMTAQYVNMTTME